MTISILEAKLKASRLQSRMAELGLTGTHAQALELMAAAFGDASWASMRSRLAAARATRVGQLHWFQCWCPGKSAKMILAPEAAAATREYARQEECSEQEIETEYDGSVTRVRHPSLAAVAAWLRGRLMVEPDSRSQFREWVLPHVSEAVPSLLTTSEVHRVLQRIARKFFEPQGFFQSLYAAVPQLGLVTVSDHASMYVHSKDFGSEQGTDWRVFTMVVNPVSLSDGKFSCDMRAVLLARSEQEAVDFTTRAFTLRHPDKQATVVKEDIAPLDKDSMMDLSCFAYHLAQQARAHSAVRACFWALVNARAPHAYREGSDAVNRDCIAQALFELARTVVGPRALQEHLAVLSTVPSYQPYVSEGSYGFFSKSRVQGISWATA